MGSSDPVSHSLVCLHFIRRHVDGAEQKRSMMNGEVSGNEVAFMIVELPVHDVELSCRNVSAELRALPRDSNFSWM